MADDFFQPISGFELPRFAGVPSFMRLPVMDPTHPRFGEVEIAIFGAPWDAGTTNRPGPRHGPRQLRDASTMTRAQHHVSGCRPFELAKCADMGDAPVNPADIQDSLTRITGFVKACAAQGALPLMVGGDHLNTLPVLRAIAQERPLGMIHFDAHTDFYHSYFGGCLYTHGTPFRRAAEEGLLDVSRVVQIGLRGTTYDSEDRDFARANGARLIEIEEFHARGVEDVMAEAREIVGDEPIYVSYDIDFVDPAFAPGTGTPEPGGPNSFQALEVARRLPGLNIVGADLVEVSPPFDPSGATAWLGANILFELTCALAESVAKKS